MLAIERRNEILEKLQTDRRVVVSELSQIYEVSEETIRRDLDKLVNDGYAIKSYGGAVINENMNICQIGGYYLQAEYQERDRLLLWEPRRTGCSSRIMQTKQLFRAKAWIWQQDLQILMNFLQITNEQCWKMLRSVFLQLTAVSLGQQPL